MARKLSKIFFRKVKGKIEVLHKQTKVNKENQSLVSQVFRKGNLIAETKVDLRDPKNIGISETVDTIVNRDYRRKGLSREMFKDTAKELSKLGKKFWRSGELSSPAQAKIRAKYDTKFIQQYAGRFMENTRFNVKAEEAIELIKDGKVVKSTTAIPLRKVSRYKTHKYVFRRINGRIVPIKVKK